MNSPIVIFEIKFTTIFDCKRTGIWSNIVLNNAVKRFDNVDHGKYVDLDPDKFCGELIEGIDLGDTGAALTVESKIVTTQTCIFFVQENWNITYK